MSHQTDDGILNLDGISSRADSFRFELLDSTNFYLGDLDIYSDSTCQIDNDSQRTIKRTLQGLSLSEATLADVNIFSDRVRPVMRLQNGSEYSLGIFLWGPVEQRLRTSGNLISVQSLVDQNLILDQPISGAVGYGAGTYSLVALDDQFSKVAGIIQPSIPGGSGRVLKEPISWTAGTSRFKVMEDLCNIAGYYPPYFDNNGDCIVRPVGELSAEIPVVIYRAGQNIIDDTLTVTNDLIDAPNRYIVVGTDANQEPITGRYDIPSIAPHSIYNRGFVVATVIQSQGVASNDDAREAAYKAYVVDSAAYEWVTFESFNDPRHDTYSAVQFNSNQYKEMSWSMSLSAGGTMSHSLRRVYA